MNVIVGDRPSIGGALITSECANNLPVLIDDFFICGKEVNIDGLGGAVGYAITEWGLWEAGKVTPVSGSVV